MILADIMPKLYYGQNDWKNYGSLVIRVARNFSLFWRIRSWQGRLNHREHRELLFFSFAPSVSSVVFRIKFRKYQKVSGVLIHCHARYQRPRII